MVDDTLWPQMVVLAEALQAGKANPCPEQVSIPIRTTRCLFHKESGPM